MTDVTNTETATGFDALKGLSSSVENDAPVYVQKLDAQGRAYATGKRKDAVARVWVKPGSGKITINNRDFSEYFARPVLQMVLRQPIVAAARDGQFDVVATVAGGGLSGQAGAVRLGVARSLNGVDPELNRPALKQAGFLTRDARVPERKKAGLKKARKAPQYSKR